MISVWTIVAEEIDFWVNSGCQYESGNIASMWKLTILNEATLHILPGDPCQLCPNKTHHQTSVPFCGNYNKFQTNKPPSLSLLNLISLLLKLFYTCPDGLGQCSTTWSPIPSRCLMAPRVAKLAGPRSEIRPLSLHAPRNAISLSGAPPLALIIVC